MEPWENPISLKRVWVYCASNTESVFVVAMSQTGSKQFRTTVRNEYGAFYKMLRTVDVHKSEAWNRLEFLHSYMGLSHEAQSAFEECILLKEKITNSSSRRCGRSLPAGCHN